MLSRLSYLSVILFAAFGPLPGCGSVTELGDPGDLGSVNSEGEETPGFDTEDPPDVQPGERPEPSGEALPDFSVADVNPNSARFQEIVSPTDYLGQISAWYFGQST